MSFMTEEEQDLVLEMILLTLLDQGRSASKHKPVHWDAVDTFIQFNKWPCVCDSDGDQ